MEEHRKGGDRRQLVRREVDRREVDKTVEIEHRLGQERRDNDERRRIIRRH